MTPEEVDAKNDELIKSYRLTFRSPLARLCVDDLMAYCGFRVPLDNENMHIAEGKRRVFLRILQFSQLTPEQVLRLFAGQPIPNREDEE